MEESVPPARNVLVVVLDTVRARSTYLGDRPLTPTLRSVAEEGTSFERAITTAPWTLPAHASMYTGRYSTEHGATHRKRYLDDSVETLAERLSGAGFRCGLFTANAFLTDSFGMDRGFDVVEFVRGSENKLFEEGLDPIKFLNEREHDSGLARYREIAGTIADGPVLKNAANAVYFRVNDLLGSAEEGIAEPFAWDETAVAETGSFLRSAVEDDRRFFAMVNLIGAHAPWPYDPARLRDVGVDPSGVADERWRWLAARSGRQWEYAAGEFDLDDDDRELLTALYESWVRAVDGLAADLVSTLDRLGVAEETLVVLTADHGECIAEEGVLGHSVAVGEDVAHVPLVASGPGVPDDRVERPVSLKDLRPTVLSLTGVDPDRPTLFDPDCQGVALTETHGIDPGDLDEGVRDAAESFGRRRAIYADDGWAERRYDSGESFGDPALLDRLDELVEDMDSAVSDEDVAVEGEIEDRLRDLGYMG